MRTKYIHEGKIYCCNCKHLGKGGCWKEIHAPNNYVTKKRMLQCETDNKEGECTHYSQKGWFD